MKTLLKNARIIKMINEDIIFGSLVIEDDKIKYIGNDYEPFGPFDIIHDCQNNVIMPGFKNAHTHSAMTFVRSKTDDQTLHDWLFDTIFPREAKLQEVDVYNLAKGAYLEYLTSGITACFDQYYFPLMSAKAAKEMGVRIVLLGTYNENNNNVDDIVRLYHEFNDENGLVSYCLGIHAEYTASEKELYWMKEAVHILKAPFYTHISETSDEVEECYRKRGMSPVAYLDSLGLFDYGGGGYHCCYFSDEDIEIFKKHHCSIVTCP
ncbi:MAG: amidohydrolase family protein, partial [Bacilli bacterium]|nr:amidohydrolase family protein [Bacilli bacterium]